MIDYQIYKLIHMIGLSMLLVGLSGVAFAFALSSSVPPKMKSMTFAFHGVGLFLILLGGFGMLARMGLVGGLPLWVYAKLAIWLAFGAGAALAKRKVMEPKSFMIYGVLMVTAAAYLALYKPF